MAIDFRITAYAPNGQSVLKSDCSSDAIGLTYEDTPSGCGAGKITLGIYREDDDAEGVYEQFNLFEISSGDMRLATACAAGATKVYLDTTEPLDPTQGEDAQILYFWDGINLAMRVPVTSIGSDSGGVFANIGAPDGRGGNPSALPAYGVGAIVGRRRYCGRVALASSQESRDPNLSISLVGLSVAWTQASGSVTCSASANVDVGTALYQILTQFATSHWPFFTFASGNFPTVGYTYADTLSTVTMDRFISDCLGAIPTADVWVVRVGHDRTPRLVKAYNASTNTFTYNRTLQQGVANFEAQQVEIDDQNIQNVYNAVTVTGSSSGASGQPITVQVTDPASITALGFQIDGPPSSNTALTTTAAATSYGAGLLAQNSLASANNRILVWTSDDLPTALYPGGPIRGDVLRALAGITVQNFDKTGIVANAAPDSAIQYGTGVGALWTISVGTGSVLPTGSPDGYGAWSLPAAGGASEAYGPSTPCAPGQVWTFTGYINPTGVGSGTGGVYRWYVVNGTSLAAIASVLVNFGGAAGTPTPQSFTVPAGVTSLRMACTVNGPAGATGNVIFAQPNLVRGSFIQPYVPNFAAPNVYGLPTSIVTTIDLKSYTTKQEAQFSAIEPDWSAFMALRQNAATTALLANRTTPMSIDRYCVSKEARGFTTTTTSLNLGLPAFLALFASGTALISIPVQNVALQASQTNYVWLVSSGSSYTITVNQSPSTVTNGILFGYFTTSASGVIGSFFAAPVGVFQIGIGNVNAAANLPAPTVSATPTISNGAALTGSSLYNGVAAAVLVGVALNNVPTDGSAQQLVWYTRQSVSAGGSGTWIPYEEQNLTISSGSVYPSASQSQNFEFDLTNGTSYDFAVGYRGIAGYGPLLYVYAGWAVKAVGIPSPYLLGGTSSPTVSSGSATATANNGLKAAFSLAFTLTNQPVDGSLSRITVWYTDAAVPGVWTPVGSFPAYGVGSASPPASHSYSFTAANLVSGTTYGFGVTYENAQGGDTPTPTQFATASATTIVIPVPYLIAGSSPTPVFSAASTIASAPALAGVSARVVLGWTINNQPTDGSLSQIAVYYRIHGSGTNWSQAFAIPAAGLPNPTNPQAYANVEIPDLTAGTAYDFGISYENAQGGQGGIASPAAWTNVTPAAIAIASQYMLAGSSLTPTVSGTPTASNVTSGDGVSAAVQVAFTLNNQPTDGSLSRVQLWVQPHGASTSNIVGAAGFYWSPYGSQAAVGVNTPFGGSIPSSGSYGFVLADLTNGATYDFAVSYENAQGFESTLLTVVSGFVAQALNIAPSQTSFPNLLTSQFLGLTATDPTGYLTMPTSGGVAIYPSTQAGTLGAYTGTTQLLSSYLTFAMRFQLSSAVVNASNFVTSSFLTSATTPGGSFSNGYYLTYKAGSPATISLAKIVAGTLTNLITRSAAIATTGFYPAQPAVPASDTNFHELRVVISPGSGVILPSPGVTISIYLDGAFMCSFAESTTTAAITSYPTGFFGSGGNVGGVAPFTSGTCGPGTGGYALVYLDPADLKLTGQASVNGDAMAQQQASLVKSPAQQLALGSPTPLQTQSVARESIAGATGEGTNQVYNPTAARGLAGWLVGDTTGGIAQSGYDNIYGGRFDLNLPIATYPAVNSAISLYQFLNNAPLRPSSTYTVSGWCEVDSVQAGGSVEIYIAQLPSGATGTTSVTYTTAVGAVFFSFTFTTSATAMGTGTSAPYLALELFSGSPAHTTVATTAEFYKLMIEQGSVATSYADSFADALVTQTHAANGQITAGLNASTAIKQQGSLIPTATTFALACTPSSSHTSYGSYGSPTPAATYSTIAYSWAAWTITYPDGTTFGFGAYSANVYVSGFPGVENTVALAPSTGYYVTAFAAAYGSGTVTTVFTAGVLSLTEAATVFADGHVTLVVNQGPITTPAQPASGTTGGGTYNPKTPTCPAVDQEVPTRRGFVRAGDLVVGDDLLDWDDGVYNRIDSLERRTSEIVRLVVGDEEFRIDRDHLWACNENRWWWPTHSLAIGDEISTVDGTRVFVKERESLGEGEFVAIGCVRKRLRIGRLLAHNFVTN